MRLSSDSVSNRDIGSRSSSRRRLGTGSNHNSPNKNDSMIQRLNIDGFFFDSSAVAAMLQNDGLSANNDDKKNGTSNQQFQSREIIFRNISIDSTVLDGAKELLRHKVGNTTTVHRTDKESNEHTKAIIPDTDIDIVHCSGLVSELIRIVLPTARRFGFAGNIPIAHNLDTKGLSIIGENLCTSEKPGDDKEDGNSEEKNGTVRLRSLVLKGTRLESSGFSRLCNGLGINTSLQELQLSTCILEEEDVLLLASTLRKNKSLKSVFFANCKFGTKTRRMSNLQNGSVVETTQSINNIYPQINLPVVLEALISHRTLESLKIYDMVCNEHAIKAIGEIVRVSGCKLKALGLKNNLSHPRGKLPGISQHLLSGLSQNNSLTYLKLSGNNLNDENMIELGRILINPRTSIQTLSVADNLISNGLLSLASDLSDAKSLRYLDVLRNPIKKQSKKAMVSALRNNVELERLDLDSSWDEEKFWWLSLNRGGRRALSLNKNIPTSVWPTILERAYNIPIRRNAKHPSSASNAGVVYYLIRRIPWLFENASSNTTVLSRPTAKLPTKASTKSTIVQPNSRTEQKRQRERTTLAEDSEPKAKRVFNP